MRIWVNFVTQEHIEGVQSECEVVRDIYILWRFSKILSNIFLYDKLFWSSWCVKQTTKMQTLLRVYLNIKVNGNYCLAVLLNTKPVRLQFTSISVQTLCIPLHNSCIHKFIHTIFMIYTVLTTHTNKCLTFALDLFPSGWSCCYFLLLLITADCWTSSKQIKKWLASKCKVDPYIIINTVHNCHTRKHNSCTIFLRILHDTTFSLACYPDPNHS